MKKTKAELAMGRVKAIIGSLRQEIRSREEAIRHWKEELIRLEIEDAKCRGIILDCSDDSCECLDCVLDI